MAFILFNHEHSNTRGFYTATYNTMNQHIFFCTNDECGNVAPEGGALCVDCCEAKLTPPVTHCEDCGAWSQVFPDNCCHTCHMKRVRSAPCEAKLTREHVCNGEWDYDLGYRVCDNSDDEDCPQHEPRCTCDGSGRMCDVCAEEYKEPCRGCGVNSHLWTDDTYCRACYVQRHGDEFPEVPPPGCVDCGKEYSIGLALDPTRCPSCVLSAQLPCMGRRSSVTSPVADPFTRLCGVEGCTTRALYYSMPPDVDEGHLILRCEAHYEPLPESPRSSCNECDRSENGEYAEDCTCPTPTRSLEDLRAAIAHIKEKLKTRMTSAQTEHWERLLEFREKELSENEAEMWAGYDADDLRKLDLQNRRGF